MRDMVRLSARGTDGGKHRPRLAAKRVNFRALNAAVRRRKCRIFGHHPRGRNMTTSCSRCGIKMQRVPGETKPYKFYVG